MLLFLSINISNLSAFPYDFNYRADAAVGSLIAVSGIASYYSLKDFPVLTEIEIDECINSDIFSINRFCVDNYNNSVAAVSDVLLGVCVAVPAMQIFDGRVQDNWDVYGLMFLENTAFSFGVTTLSKVLMRMPRPYVYNKNVPNEVKSTLDARQSFFSGHSCLAFAGMTFFAQTYSDLYPSNSNHTLIWAGSMSLAAATAILRLLSGRHFPIDVLVGSAVGFAVGKLIPNIHKYDKSNNNLPEFKVNKIFSYSLNL